MKYSITEGFVPCEVCKGTGVAAGGPCPACKGEGGKEVALSNLGKMAAHVANAEQFYTMADQAQDGTGGNVNVFTNRALGDRHMEIARTYALASIAFDLWNVAEILGHLVAHQHEGDHHHG